MSHHHHHHQSWNDSRPSSEIRLPNSIERVLSNIERRIDEIGIRRDEVDDHILGKPLRRQLSAATESSSSVESTTASAQKPNHRKRKRTHKKRTKKRLILSDVPADEQLPQPEVEYVPEDLPVDRSDPFFSYFRSVAQHFRPHHTQTKNTLNLASKYGSIREFGLGMKIRDRTLLEDEDDDKELKNDEQKKISKKQMKKMTRMSVAELKQIVQRPDVVEMHDVTARDPKLLVFLKSLRNTVPVPRHWSGKRKYLQGKRGFVKPPFELPEFIKRTGIMEMRQSVQDKDDRKSLKQKMRERMRPKLGKIEIDYQKLHDAFFKYQTKPTLSIHGDLYYEGKENELKLKQVKPGLLSDDLRIALGMPAGTLAERVPPPWLIAMQRYGPPPSYPNLKIPGLNSPIPAGCSFGYHPGGWGKPPVDEMGRPLYGDVFGTLSNQTAQDVLMNEADENVDKTLWGELEIEEVDDDEDDQDEDDEVYMNASPDEQPESASPSGISSAQQSSVAGGIETPANVQIRKRVAQDETGSLYHVIPEKPTSVGNALMGSTKIYDVKAANVDVSIQPDDLDDLDAANLEKRYQEQVQSIEKQESSNTDKRRRKKQTSDGSVSSSRKDFKF